MYLTIFIGIVGILSSMAFYFIGRSSQYWEISKAGTKTGRIWLKTDPVYEPIEFIISPLTPSDVDTTWRMHHSMNQIKHNKEWSRQRRNYSGGYNPICESFESQKDENDSDISSDIT